MANGKEKTALERAKDFHKSQGTTASEALLTDAYLARIESLARQNLVVEAKALLEVVRDRYPLARPRLDELTAIVSAHAGVLDELLRPLGNPDLPAERRTAIESYIEEQLVDLGAIAECNGLSPDDPLRRAAAALKEAFVAVTSGPVTEEVLGLGEISHRSPLASWKLLVRAIGCLYRNDDDACRQYLDRIKTSSAPARLIPAIRKMLGEGEGTPLSGESAKLVSSVTGGRTELRRSLEELDRNFDSGNHERIFESIRAATRECRSHAPSLTERLGKHVAVRCAMIDVTPDKVAAATGGKIRRDADFLRLLARGMEATKDVENYPLACTIWEEFRLEALREGWFKANGAEAAALYLHMAALLRKVPPDLLKELSKSMRGQANAAGFQDLDFLQPEKLYERACALDPHSDAFAQWFAWSSSVPHNRANAVARAWHKILPGDLEPILHLMLAGERTGAFPTALEFLTKAERIDSLHTDVRHARFRLLAGNAMRQIQQKKIAQAEKTLDVMAMLPQAQEGDDASLVAVLRYVARSVAGDDIRADVYRADAERLLQSRLAASLLIASVAANCRQAGLETPMPAKKLDPGERATLPAVLARIITLAKQARLKLIIPRDWLSEIARHFKKSREALNTNQLCTLGEAGLFAGNFELAYAASAAGLERGGSSEGEFLLLRAKALPDHHFVRRAVCAAAAAELARQERNTALIEDAVGFIRDELSTDGPTITLEDTAEVLRKEKKESVFPKGYSRGPDYRKFAPTGPCQCAKCRSARVEFDDDDEDDDDFFDVDDFIDNELPPGMPPEIGRMLYEETKKAIERGESLDQLMARLMGSDRLPGGRKKKGKRK